MTEIMPVPRNLILLSYQQRAYAVLFFSVMAQRTDWYVLAPARFFKKTGKIQGCHHLHIDFAQTYAKMNL